MALLPAVGRTSPGMRLFIFALYATLSLGAVTMLYPFLSMLSMSVGSQYDAAAHDIVPRYLTSPAALFGKYAEDKYRGDMTQINAAYGTNFAKLSDVAPPAAVNTHSARDWDAFVSALPDKFKAAGFSGAPGAYSPAPLLDTYRMFLRERFGGDIRALDRAYSEEDDTFLSVFPPFEQPARRSYAPAQTAKARDWRVFTQTLPARYFTITGADPLYAQWLKEERYSKPADLNAAWGTKFTVFTDAALSVRPTGNAVQRGDWETFVRTKLPFRDVIVSLDALPAWRAFLAKRYPSVSIYNTQHGTQFVSFAGVPLPDPETLAHTGPALLDWLDFLKAAPLSALSADTPELRWQAKYGQAERHAGAMTAAAAASDWQFVRAHPGPLRRDFLARNYRLVADYFLLHGRAVWVTVLYCGLAILTALVVNPLCAYALSRYNLPAGQAVLLFLLSTMAFPAEVTMIPGFLLLKQLNLLNTFYALILPGAASGFSVFLLKGFFDSLPKELYEAGTLDGASEMRMFLSITLPLSRPIFAVIALGAFSAAYGNFLFALLTCQDRSMWTLMVWLYELQSSGAPQFVMMAALTLASIPTLLVFIFAQRTIMRGIILPSFK